MKNLAAAAVTPGELATLRRAMDELPAGSQLREAMETVSETVESGRDVMVAPESDLITPSAAARLIGVSRTHLYKLLDVGEIAYTSVGRDRRIAIRDLRNFQNRQEELRKSVAERFAHPGETRANALRGLAARRRG